MGKPGLSGAEWQRVDRVMRFVTFMESSVMAREHPRACRWHEVWTEFRPRVIRKPGDGADSAGYEADVVTVWVNLRTRKRTEMVQFRGTGDNLPGVVLDLLAQAEHEIQRLVREHGAGDPSATVQVDIASGTFPMMGMFAGPRARHKTADN